MGRTYTLADGQVAAAAAAILAGSALDTDTLVQGVFQNTAGTTETVVVTMKRSGGTARRIARAVLTANEQLIFTGQPMQLDDTLLAVTSNGSAVDYVISRSDGPFNLYTLDANGAIKNGASSIASGNQTISGDLIVSGGDLDLGASGAAGTLDIFPTTASKGKTQFTSADNTGDTTTTVAVGAQATTRTYTLADALASCNFLMGMQAAVARTATADGLTTGTIADGGRLQHITVTSADANHIIVLPTPTPGTIVVLANAGTGFELRSSTPASIAINGGTGANAESAIAASSVVVAFCVTATDWRAFFLDADGDVAKVEAAAT